MLQTSYWFKKYRYISIGIGDDVDDDDDNDDDDAWWMMIVVGVVVMRTMTTMT